MIAWARENTPTCGPADHAAFCDYWRSVPGAKGRKLDWVATWRNWMRKEHNERARRNGRVSSRHQPHSGARNDPNATYSDDPEEVFGT
jgi:hypothetical protein